VRRLVLSLSFCAALVVEAGSLSHDGCHAVWDENRLTVSNACFSRVYVPVGETLRTRSFRIGGSELIDAERVPAAVGNAPIAETYETIDDLTDDRVYYL